MDESEQAAAGRMAMRAKPGAMHRINITLPEELFERAVRFGTKEYIGSFSEVVRQALVLMMKKAKADAATDTEQAPSAEVQS